jgi:predicted RNase H-like HicB family nuclease
MPHKRDRIKDGALEAAFSITPQFCMEYRQMDYRVVLIESDEGFAVSCPELRGCHSQGETKAEALENICEAIQEWLAAEEDEKSVFSISEETVTV